MPVDMIKMATNKVLNDVIDTAIFEALRLKTRGKEYAERKRQQNPDQADIIGDSYFQEGIHALNEVLWKVFGGYPYEILKTIDKLSEKYDGYMSADFTAEFIKTLEDVRTEERERRAR